MPYESPNFHVLKLAHGAGAGKISLSTPFDAAQPQLESPSEFLFVATQLSVAAPLIVTEKLGRREVVFQMNCAELSLGFADLRG